MITIWTKTSSSEQWEKYKHVEPVIRQTPRRPGRAKQLKEKWEITRDILRLEFSQIDWAELGLLAREEVVFCMRFCQGQTREDISNYFGVSRSRIHQIEMMAEFKLQHPSATKRRVFEKLYILSILRQFINIKQPKRKRIRKEYIFRVPSRNNLIGGNWNASKVAQLEALVGKKLSAAEIGQRLGFTKSAIIGKMNRLGLKCGKK